MFYGSKYYIGLLVRIAIKIINTLPWLRLYSSSCYAAILYSMSDSRQYRRRMCKTLLY